MAMFEKHKTPKSSPAPNVEPELSRPAQPAPPSPSPSAGKVAMIGQGIDITGDVKADSNLKVEGRIEGRNVQSSQDVEIGESGTVRANIIAKNVKVAGEVVGDIGGAEKVFIARTGRVQGNIVAPRVQVEEGALLRGSIDMNPSQAASGKQTPAQAQAKAQAATQAKAQSSSQAKPDVPKSVSAGKDREEPGLTLKSG